MVLSLWLPDADRGGLHHLRVARVEPQREPLPVGRLELPEGSPATVFGASCGDGCGCQDGRGDDDGCDCDAVCGCQDGRGDDDGCDCDAVCGCSIGFSGGTSTCVPSR